MNKKECPFGVSLYGIALSVEKTMDAMEQEVHGLLRLFTTIWDLEWNGSDWYNPWAPKTVRKEAGWSKLPGFFYPRDYTIEHGIDTESSTTLPLWWSRWRNERSQQPHIGEVQALWHEIHRWWNFSGNYHYFKSENKVYNTIIHTYRWIIRKKPGSFSIVKRLRSPRVHGMNQPCISKPRWGWAPCRWMF